MSEQSAGVFLASHFCPKTERCSENYSACNQVRAMLKLSELCLKMLAASYNKIEMDGFRVRRYRTFPFCVLNHFDSNTSDPMKTELSESQAEADEPTNHSGSSQAIR